MNLNQYLDLRPGVRSRCPFCDARRGLAISDSSRYDVGGVYKCFACDRSGSGIAFLVEARSMTRADASAALGLTPQMAVVNLDRERSRAAWARLDQAKRNWTLNACRDLVFLRNHMTRSERADWRRHEMLPHRLRASEQAQRQGQRVKAYIKEKAQ